MGSTPLSGGLSVVGPRPCSGGSTSMGSTSSFGGLSHRGLTPCLRRWTRQGPMLFRCVPTAARWTTSAA